MSVLISDPYFEESQGSVVKVLVGMGQTAVDNAETDLLAAYNDCISTMKRDVEHLDQWSDFNVSTDFLLGDFVHCEPYWVIQAGLLTPLTFAWHRLSPFGAFTSGAYFLHNRRW